MRALSRIMIAFLVMTLTACIAKVYPPLPAAHYQTHQCRQPSGTMSTCRVAKWQKWHHVYWSHGDWQSRYWQPEYWNKAFWVNGTFYADASPRNCCHCHNDYADFSHCPSQRIG